MRLRDFAASSTVRSSLVAAGAFSAAILILFFFVYWQTQTYITGQIDRSLLQEVSTLESRDPARLPILVGERLLQVPRQFDFAGLFAPDGHREAGNLKSIPPELLPDRPARETFMQGPAGSEPGSVAVRAIAHRLPDGRTLVLGRSLALVHDLAAIMARTLAIGALPASILALLIGVLLAIRGERRLARVNHSIRRIIAGHLRERLPVHGATDGFAKLAGSVNHMLAEIEALLQSIAGVGDDMAHELRTPLTRVRARLERARDKAEAEEMRRVLDEAVLEIDQCLAIVTALLRIAEIEHSRRLAGFGTVALAPLLREVHEFYEPTAEAKGITLQCHAAVEAQVVGDHDLLFEALANLVDNAVKFTPAGGDVAIMLARDGAGPVLRVADTGPGIGETEIASVTKRFYRSDKSRHASGSGLGLSLVAAIAKLHGFTLRLSSGTGCVAEIHCRTA